MDECGLQGESFSCQRSVHTIDNPNMGICTYVASTDNPSPKVLCLNPYFTLKFSIAIIICDLV